MAAVCLHEREELQHASDAEAEQKLPEIQAL